MRLGCHWSILIAAFSFTAQTSGCDVALGTGSGDLSTTSSGAETTSCDHVSTSSYCSEDSTSAVTAESLCSMPDPFGNVGLFRHQACSRSNAVATCKKSGTTNTLVYYSNGGDPKTAADVLTLCKSSGDTFTTL